MEGRAFLVSVKALNIFPCAVKPEVVWKVKTPLVECACYVMRIFPLPPAYRRQLTQKQDPTGPSTIFCRKTIFLGVNFSQKR